MLGTKRMRKLTTVSLPVEQRCLFALLSLLPVVGSAGLYTAPSNPTFNLGPESARMTGVKTRAVTAGVGGLITDFKWDTSSSGGAGGSDGGNSGVRTGFQLPTHISSKPDI